LLKNEVIMHDRNKKFYFVGIGGLGMSSVAGLLKQAGYLVTGSDSGMSDAVALSLREENIPFVLSYNKENIESSDADIFVIGNSLSRGHVELEAVLASGKSYTSFPQVLEDYCLENKRPIVVCGTHGKSTTTSWISHCLESLKEKPSYMIGAIPAGKKGGSLYGSGSLFVLEGDEYDTAFFDKGSKFLHYKPQFVVLNNIEFDHADIFKDLEAIYETFKKLLLLVKEPSQIIANIDDKGVRELLKKMSLFDKVYRVSPSGKYRDEAHLFLNSIKESSFGRTVFHYEKKEGSFIAEVTLTGSYNVANALQCLGLLSVLKEKGAIKKASEFDLLKSLSSFKGVQKRLENLGSFQGALVYRDFGHHPTAMACTLENLRQLYPKSKIIAGFEPKNATSRRNTFFKQYGEVLQSADQVFLLRAPEDKRIPENERMNVDELKRIYLKDKAFVLPDKETLKNWCHENFEEGVVSVFFSSSSFLDVPSELVLS